MEQTDIQTDREQRFEKKEKKNTFTTKASSFCRNTHSPHLNPNGPSLNPPACPVLAVSRIIIYLYLNTHKAYTGKGTTTQEKKKKNKVIHRAGRVK